MNPPAPLSDAETSHTRSTVKAMGTCASSPTDVMGASLSSIFMDESCPAHVREDRTCARNDMTFAPRWSERCPERFQLPLEIASGFSSGSRCELENLVLLEIENPQLELCRSLRERLMVDHAVSAIHDPGIRVSLCNGSRQVGKRRHSDRDAATFCRCEFSDER